VWRSNLPNALSILRLALVPVLLVLAWQGRRTPFLWCFGAALASDVVDGFVARRFGSASELGARLDSWGDLVIYAALPLAAWWLWPERASSRSSRRRHRVRLLRGAHDDRGPRSKHHELPHLLRQGDRKPHRASVSLYPVSLAGSSIWP
jgi:hypothetical protein